MISQCKRKYLLRNDNYIFLLISFLLWLIFSFFIQRKTCCVNTCDGRPGLFESYERTNARTLLNLRLFIPSRTIFND